MSTEQTLYRTDAARALDPSRELARSLDCITEADLCLLSGVSPSTAESWRKRGTGPAYILFGNRYLYPRAGLSEHLQGQVRNPRKGVAKDLL